MLGPHLWSSVFRTVPLPSSMSFAPPKPAGLQTSRAASRPASASRNPPTMDRPAPSAPAFSPHTHRGTTRLASASHAAAAAPTSAASGPSPSIRSPPPSRLLQRASPLSLRRPPNLAFTFSRVAKDVLILCMQFCSSASLLRLARCSRFTLDAASIERAWRRASLEPFSVSSAVAIGPRRTGAPLPRSLLRFCTIALRWMPLGHFSRFAGDQARDHDVPAICDIPHLRALTAMHCSPQKSQWLTLIRHSALAQLTELRTFSHADWFDTECLAEAVRLLPQVRILHLHALLNHFSVGCFEPLKNCSSLTELSLHTDDLHDHLAPMGRCSSLTRLSLQAATAHAMRWSLILADPALQCQIRHLTLVSVLNQPEEQIADCLCAFAGLEELRVQSFTRVKDLITHLTNPQRLPSLKHFAICASAGSHVFQPEGPIPRRAQLMPLMESRPALHVTLWFPSLKLTLVALDMDSWLEASVPIALRKLHATLSAEYIAMQAAMTGRMHLRSKLMVPPP